MRSPLFRQATKSPLWDSMVYCWRSEFAPCWILGWLAIYWEKRASLMEKRLIVCQDGERCNTGCGFRFPHLFYVGPTGIITSGCYNFGCGRKRIEVSIYNSGWLVIYRKQKIEKWNTFVQTVWLAKPQKDNVRIKNLIPNAGQYYAMSRADLVSNLTLPPPMTAIFPVWQFPAGGCVSGRSANEQNDLFGKFVQKMQTHL